MSEARNVVTKRITFDFKRFPDIGLKPLDVGTLDARDAALARAIDHAIHRRWITLTTLIAHASNRIVHKLDAPVGATLLVATAQLMLLDRIPDHAVINCAVDWIRNHGHPRATGFVNAVLRKITRVRGELLESGVPGQANHFLRNDGSAWELLEDVFTDGVQTQTGFAKSSWDRLVYELGEEDAIFVAVASIAEPPVIVTTAADDTLPPQIIPHTKPHFGVVPHGTELTSLFAESTQLRVQDPTSASSLELLHELHPYRILDQCAGRGTKTKQLRTMFPDAMIGATEPNDARRSSLLEIAPAIDAIVYAPGEDGPVEPFDLIVVDSPCSNSGVFARRPEAKYRYNKKHIESLVELQREILNDAVSILQNKGFLLYATCSIDQAENQAQVNWLVEKYQMRLIDEKFTLPSGTAGSDPTLWHDGGFAALLQAR